MYFLNYLWEFIMFNNSNSATRELSIERRNEIAWKAILFQEMKNDFFVSFQEKGEQAQKNLLLLAEKLSCSKEELKKFIKEFLLTLFKAHNEIHEIKEPTIDFIIDDSPEWKSKRNEIAYAKLINDVIKKGTTFRFSPDTLKRKKELYEAYECNSDELKYFREEVTNTLMQKTFELF